MSTKRRLALAAGLFLLAPLVGEFLLGNQPITALPWAIFLGPMYGGGALLIREFARRAGRGWPTIVLLAAAYALLEEGPIDQMIFNPKYLGMDSFAGQAYLPGAGISVSLVQASLTLHTVWSICVPIVLVEAFSPERTRPWLGRVGLSVTGAIFVLGSTALGIMQGLEFHFLASPAQLVVTSAVIVALAVAAFWIGRRPHNPVVAPDTAPLGSPDVAPVAPALGPTDQPAPPRPWRVGAVAFGLTSAYWASSLLPEGGVRQWLDVAVWFPLVGVAVVLGVRWTRRSGWSDRHSLAVAGGALLTYAWAGFLNSLYNAEYGGAPLGIAFAGNVVFGLCAVVLLAFATRAVRRRTARQRETATATVSPQSAAHTGGGTAHESGVDGSAHEDAGGGPADEDAGGDGSAHEDAQPVG
ncbi:MAG: hypothetical protein WCA46_00500 [Actinocatenispora sp.]